jgi:hypothetical protein
MPEPKGVWVMDMLKSHEVDLHGLVEMAAAGNAAKADELFEMTAGEIEDENKVEVSVLGEPIRQLNSLEDLMELRRIYDELAAFCRRGPAPR